MIENDLLKNSIKQLTERIDNFNLNEFNFSTLNKVLNE